MKSIATANYIFKDFTELTEDEIRLIWELRNHPDIRRWMTNSRPIEFADHLQFIGSLSRRNDLRHYLVKDNSSLPIGSVNITFLSDDKVERGIYINPAYHGMGHAKRLLTEFYEKIHQQYFVNWVLTKVFRSNTASNALEHSLGALATTGESPEYNYYLLHL